MIAILTILLVSSVANSQDPCHTAHTDQASCDADKKTGGGCTWCKCAAVPSACFTIADSKKLPPGVYECDSSDLEDRTILEVNQGVPSSADSLDWKQSRRSPASTPISVVVHLTHKEEQLNKLEEIFWAVSNPDSPRYGQHLTSKQVTEIVKHDEKSIQAVLKFLSSVETPTKLRVGAHLDSIKVTLSASAIEKLFQTEMYQFVHRERNIIIHRSGSRYSVPSKFASSIELVSGLMQLPDLSKLSGFEVVDDASTTTTSSTTPWPTDCKGCGTNKVTPGVLAARYSFPTPTTSDPPATLAVSEFQGQVWDQSDLNKFSSTCSGSVNFNVTVNHENGTISKGGLCKIPIIGTETCGEALLDIEYAKAVGGPSVSLTDIYIGQYNLLNWATR
jgi:subtilase family serine protease